jgi:hypothetical protein
VVEKYATGLNPYPLRRFASSPFIKMLKMLSAFVL